MGSNSIIGTTSRNAFYEGKSEETATLVLRNDRALKRTKSLSICQLFAKRLTNAQTSFWTFILSASDRSQRQNHEPSSVSGRFMDAPGDSTWASAAWIARAWALSFAASYFILSEIFGPGW
jgi:hypothetical protein